jgi:hypothetical protein
LVRGCGGSSKAKGVLRLGKREHDAVSQSRAAYVVEVPVMARA